MFANNRLSALVDSGKTLEQLRDAYVVPPDMTVLEMTMVFIGPRKSTMARTGSLLLWL